MGNKFEKTNLTIDLNDYESVSYYYENNNLNMKIKTWDLKIICITFYKVILFVDWGESNYISNFYLNKEKTSFLLPALEKEGNAELLENSPYNLYQFVDAFMDPCFEIACLSFDFTIQPSRTS